MLSEQQRSLILEDHGNKKVWDEALGFLTEGPVHTNPHMHTHTQVILLYSFLITPYFLFFLQNFLRKVEQIFMCVCCQELAYQPITTPCQHNVCKVCVVLFSFAVKGSLKHIKLSTVPVNDITLLLCCCNYRAAYNDRSEPKCSPAQHVDTIWEKITSWC